MTSLRHNRTWHNNNDVKFCVQKTVTISSRGPPNLSNFLFERQLSHLTSLFIQTRSTNRVPKLVDIEEETATSGAVGTETLQQSLSDVEPLPKV